MIRDDRAVENGITFNYQRLMDHAYLLMDPEGKLRISYRDKVKSLVELLFENRARFHRCV